VPHPRRHAIAGHSGAARSAERGIGFPASGNRLNRAIPGARAAPPAAFAFAVLQAQSGSGRWSRAGPGM